jgi:hypothetical protein
MIQHARRLFSVLGLAAATAFGGIAPPAMACFRKGDAMEQDKVVEEE